MADHYCTEHKTVFFKRGNMRDYAHPIGDTGKWCNEFKKVAPVDNGQKREEIFPEESKSTPKPSNPDRHDPRNRSMCLSYAKDLACAGKITLEQIATYADKFLEYLER